MKNEPVPNFDLQLGAALQRAFLSRGLTDFHACIAYVRSLPYGRTSDAHDFSLVLTERRGTCSSKHALLAATAREAGAMVSLVLGIYEMCESNTPGVAAVLNQFGLEKIPEAHCLLRSGSVYTDVTGLPAGAEPISFVYVEEISPEQIGSYKSDVHRHFVTEWGLERGLDPQKLWEVRETCIEALADRGRHDAESG